MFFTHSFADGQLGWFHILALVNSAGAFESFEYIPRRGMYG